MPEYPTIGGGGGGETDVGIGGGSSYDTLHTGGDYEPSTLSELENALSSASSGDVVFIDGTIDTGNTDNIVVPSGVTLAGDRGVDSSTSSVLVCDDRSVNPLLAVHGTVEGIEIDGPIPDVVRYVGDQDVDYPIGIGLEMMDDSEIANCNLHHFGKIVTVPDGQRVHIHHSEIAWAAVEGLGYAIDADPSGGDADRTLIEYNFMHTARHEIAAHGGAGYILRYNIFGEEQLSETGETWSDSLDQQRVDDHDCCAYHECYRNTFRQPGEIFSFRDGTDDRAECHHNWFHDPDPIGMGEWPSGNVYDNAFGESEPAEDVGAPRGSGGGADYHNAIQPSDADYTVTTKSELQNALGSAASGEVVYIDGSSDINMGTSTFSVPSGVTLASDRGVNGAPGGRVYTTEHPDGILTVQADAHLSGVRIEGPRTGWYTRADSTDVEVGVIAAGTAADIENCQIWGWGEAGVRCEAADTHVHYCHLHTCPEESAGVGVATTDESGVLVEFCRFQDNRHAIESGGVGGYIARHNYVLGATIGQIFDQNDPGGDRIEVYNNTVEAAQHDQDGSNVPGVAIYGTPSDVADITHNWFFNPQAPLSSPNGETDEAIIQVGVSEWSNVVYADNHYGSSEPSASDVGVQEQASPSCTVDSDCSAGHHCVNGSCEPIPDADYDHHLDITTSDDAPSDVDYTLVTPGHIKAGPDADLGGNDDISELDTGNWQATGTTGGGYADDYYFMGDSAVSWSCSQPEEYWTLYLDGAQVSAAELTGDDSDGGGDTPGDGTGDDGDSPGDDDGTVSDGTGLGSHRLSEFRLGPGASGDVTTTAELAQAQATSLVCGVSVTLAAHVVDTDDARFATTGDPYPSTTGTKIPSSGGRPRTRPDATLPLPTVDGDYALTLIRDSGPNPDADSVVIEGDSLDIDYVSQLMPVRKHSAVSDWSLRVPYGVVEDEALIDWVRARVYLTYDNQIVFVGKLRRVDPQESKGFVSLEGTDMGGDLRSGSLIFETEGVTEWEAIKQCWEHVAPDWDVTVTRPPPAQQRNVGHWPGRRFEDGFDGSPLNILQKIHEDLGYRFIIDRTRPHTAVSFRAGDVTLPQMWTPTETNPMRDIGGYFNHAVVKGAIDDATDRRVRGEYRDDAEIQRLMTEHGMSEAQATETWNVTDPELTTDWGCEQRAERLVEDGVQEDSVTATVRCPPTLVKPGASYTIEDLDDDRIEGAYSLRFTGEPDSYVEFENTRPWSTITPNGTITLWVRPDEGIDPLVPVIGSQTTSMRLGWAGRSLTMHVNNVAETDVVRLHAYPDADVPLGEWSFVHYDWQYDPDDDATTVRAGRNDVGITDTKVLAGKPKPPTQRWWFGREVNKRYHGNLDDVRFWAGRLPLATREALANRERVNGPLRHKWAFRSPPTAPRGTIYDLISNVHGQVATATDVVYDGNPLPLETVDFRESHGTADGTLHFDDAYDLAEELAHLRTREDRSRRFL